MAGSDITFFPYEYMDGNTPAGFDVEYLKGLAQVMGLESELVDTRFPNLIPGLKSNRFDLIISAMYITESRAKVVDFIPYLKGGESILVLKGSEFQPEVPEELCGHSVGSMAATGWLEKLEQLSKEYCVANGMEPISLRTFPTDPETTQALLSHAVEAQVTDHAVATGVVEKLRGRAVISSKTLLYPVLNGIAIRKGDSAVREALIEGMEQFKQTPEYAALLDRYHFEAPSAEDLDTLMP